MNEIPIDELHSLIDQTEEVIREIDRRNEVKIKIETLTDLSFIILDVIGYSSSAYGETQLGINPAHLNKFVKMRGEIRKHDALAIANRIRTYLKSQDQAFVAKKQPKRKKRTENIAHPPKAEKKSAPPKVVAIGEQWIAVGGTSQIKRSIAIISTLLENIIDQANGSNAPPDQKILSEIERKQLVAILETALNLLKSPLVEKGLLKKTKAVLEEVGEKAAKKSMQEGLGKLMTVAGSKIGDLLLLWIRN